MSSFKKLNTKVFARNSQELHSDNVYWKNYNVSVLVKEFGPIDHIDFSPVEPYHFAVTCSCRVQVFNPITKLVIKNINRFKKLAYGGTFRKDGRLLCVGGVEPVVRLFDVNTRNLLRIFSGHEAAVHRTYFTSDGICVASFSDDKSVVLWDIPSERKLMHFKEHTDYVRAGNVSPISPHIIISGGYDKIVNLYDTRVKRKILSVSHDSPVESVMFLPSGGVFLSAGGTEIKVWDSLTNGRLLSKISQHHKTITSLQVACNGKRILSGSLDRHVKIYDSGSYRTLHTLKYPNSILSISVSPDDKTIVTGMIDGMISVKQRDENTNKIFQHQKVSYKYAGEIVHNPKLDVNISTVSLQIMGKHDIYLRKFLYTKALDSVMVNYIVNKSPHITVALFQELIRRQGLTQALAGRDDKSLTNILKFLNRFIGSARFGRTISYITNTLIDIYEDRLKELCIESQIAYKNLQKKITEEHNLILSLTTLRGSIEMLLCATEAVKPVIKDFNHFIPSISAQKDLIFSL